MAKAIRTDLMEYPPWLEFVRNSRNRGCAVYEEKCHKCNVKYSIVLGVMEDIETAVKLMRYQLLNDCPEHSPETYTIEGDLPGRGRVIADPSD